MWLNRASSGIILPIHRQSISPSNMSMSMHMSLQQPLLLNLQQSILPSSSSTVYFQNQVRYATKKSGGSSANGRTSQPKMLGIKRGDGASIQPGQIILRQRGTQWHAGPGVG